MKNYRIGGYLFLTIFIISGIINAENNKDINKLLLDKGIITTNEYNDLSTPPPTTSSMKPTIKVGGRIMIDAAFYDSDDANFHNGTEIRRARIFVAGDIGDKWFYKTQYDLVYPGREGIRDMYLGHLINENTKLRIGNFPVFGSMEDTTSSKYITFMERSTPMLLFQPAVRRIGIGINSYDTHWYAGGGVFGKRPDVDDTGDESIGSSVRFAAIPINSKKRTLHIGVSGGWRQPDNDVLQFKARPESHISNIKILNTLAISNVNDRISYGAELAGTYGRFSAQAEYLGVIISRYDYEDESFNGFYAQGSWFLTGESRPYYSEYGTFGRIKPIKSIGNGGIGAWELAARYSNIDISGHEYNGKVDNITIGLNWYTTPHTRFMLNYVNSSTTTAIGEIDVNIVQMRAQVDF